jgi:hypothetical protein
MLPHSPFEQVNKKPLQVTHAMAVSVLLTLIIKV